MLNEESKSVIFDRVNLLLALCAIVISAASFYATYIQADAAEKQVKATTWPYLQFGSSNISDDYKEPNISFVISNGGVGPAHIKSFTMNYEGKVYKDVYSWMKDCCDAEFKLLNKHFEDNSSSLAGGIITTGITNNILSAGQSLRFLSLKLEEHNKPLWDKLNEERRKLSANVCYCSLLDNCYESDFESDVKEVEACT